MRVDFPNAPALPRSLPAADSLIGEEAQAATDRVLASGVVAQGPEVAALEAEFAAHLDRGAGCVAVNSQAGGLYLGLLASGVRPGDEVIVPSFGSAGPANAVARTGAAPVFVDIDRATYCLDPAAVAAAITPRTVGILLAHQYGHPAAVDALDALAYRYDLQIFEDATQAYGAKLRGRPVGTIGSFASFSLHPAKTQMLGEGTLVTTATPDAERRLRRYRNLGVLRLHESQVVDFEHRMTDLHGAIERGAADQGRPLDRGTLQQRRLPDRQPLGSGHPLRGVRRHACLPPVRRAGARRPERLRHGAARRARRGVRPAPHSRAPAGTHPSLQLPAGHRAGGARVPVSPCTPGLGTCRRGPHCLGGGGRCGGGRVRSTR